MVAVGVSCLMVRKRCQRSASKLQLAGQLLASELLQRQQSCLIWRRWLRVGAAAALARRV